MSDVINCLTIDLEPWMCFYDNPLLKKELDSGSLVELAHRIMNLLDRCSAKATFFVLGAVYDWYPDLVEELAKEGHEVAFHTYSHRRVVSRGLLLQELRSAAEFIERFCPTGFRAPQMKLPHPLLEVLSSHGFRYDSSAYAAVGKPVAVACGSQTIAEVPVSTYPIVGEGKRVKLPRTMLDSFKSLEIPVGSGAFIALLSAQTINKIVAKLNEEGKSFIAFVHPWQLVGVRRIPSSLVERLAKLPYLKRIDEEKLEAILSQHCFETIESLVSRWRESNRFPRA